MKLSDGITHCPDHGICTLDLNKICKCFGEHSTISRCVQRDASDEYRLHNQRAKVKVTISETDAKEIIKRLGLVEHVYPIFPRNSVYMKPWRKEQVIKDSVLPDKVLEVIQFVNGITNGFLADGGNRDQVFEFHKMLSKAFDKSHLRLMSIGTKYENLYQN